MLTTTWAQEGMYFSFPSDADPVVVAWELGWDRRHDNTNEEYYWAGVRDAIIKPVLLANRYMRSNMSKVLLYVECAMEQRFQHILREAVDDVLSRDIETFSRDPVYAAARGAAEMAKQQWWNYNCTGSS